MLSISPSQIDHQVDRSVTPHLCVRKLQYCTALVANKICKLIEKEQEVKRGGRKEGFQGSKEARRVGRLGEIKHL